MEINIKDGYKKTELGIIPDDWEVKKLGDISDVKTGPFGSSLHEKDYVYDGIPIITVEHLSDKGVVHKNLPMVSDFDKNRLSSYILKTGDIVFSRVGSVDRNSLISKLENGWLFSSRLLRIRINLQNISPAYLSYHFLQEPTKHRIRSVAVGQTMASLNTTILKSIDISLPPLAEQKAIAHALSDVDNLITAIDQLITKKRNLKQGTMQELLTGKKRLPGFSGKWEVKKLGDICNYINDGTHYTPKYINDGIPFYSVENVTTNNFHHTKYISKEEHNFLVKRCNPQKGDILLTRIGTLGKTKLIDWNVEASIYVSLALLKLNNNIDSNYLYTYTKSNQFVQDVIKRSLVNATPQKINMGDIDNIPIPIPPLPEQKAIAEILTDMDKEIEALEKKRDKYKAIKQGMMQELLTGKTRIIDN